MRLLVVGAGATGGYFGGRLAEAGKDVTFLVRPARAARLRAEGLRLVSPNGDAVLLAVKAFSLDAALDDMAPSVGPETMILPVLNGMKHVDALTERFGRRAVAGCVCKVVTLIDDDGRVVQLPGPQELAYGELDGTTSLRIERLDAFMRGGGFDARLSSAIEREMWEKWVLLATLGGVNSLMRGTIGEIEAVPGGTAFVLRLLDEVLAVVRAEGQSPSAGFVDQARAMMTARGSAQTSSMYRDLCGGRPIEADQIIGDLVARGRAAGVETPLLAAAYANLMIYQSRLTAKRDAT